MFAAALLTAPSARARVRETLRGGLELRLCDTCSELRGLALGAGASIVVTEPVDRHMKAAWPVVAEIRRAFPRLPVLGYCSLRASVSGDIVDLVRAGVHDIAISDVDDSVVALRSKLARARAIGTAEWALCELAPLLNRNMNPVVHYCLTSAARSTTVRELADVFAVNRKTLVNWCRDACAPPPGNLLSWCRVLMAAELLEDEGRSVEHIALELNFPTAGAMRAMLKRYMSLGPQGIRAAGGARYVLDALKRTLSNNPGALLREEVVLQQRHSMPTV